MSKVKVIYGSPLSGKTTYVKERLSNNDIVYDYDDLMQVMTVLPYQKHNQNVADYILDIRSLMINRLKNDTKIDTAYIITTFLSNELKQELNGMNVEYVKMSTDYMTVMNRLRKSNRAEKERVRFAIIDWFQKYTDNKQKEEKYGSDKNKKIFYRSSEWDKLRQHVIDRDNGECQECKRRGKVTLDSIKQDGMKKKPQLNVHHIMEIEYFPEWALEPDNLITVCISCHNRIHNKLEKLKFKKNKWKDDERW
ncbi:HNH endonuclease [Oceanobacillus caeni]